eukprot:scaffold24390_cov144-Skeletonema_menzelii.AAC.12
MEKKISASGRPNSSLNSRSASRCSASDTYKVCLSRRYFLPYHRHRGNYNGLQAPPKSYIAGVAYD